MSLATSAGGMSAGGAGGGGLVMGHQASAMARPAAQPPPGASIPGMDGGGAPSTSIAALGADLVDKSQLSMKQVKNVSHLPIVAVDMYGSDPMVASFPPKPAEADLSLQATLVGKFQPEISFQKNETAHKTLRKYLTKDKTYNELRKNALSTSSTKDVVTIVKPHRWMGMRRLKDTPDYIKDTSTVVMHEGSESGTSSAISEEASLDSVHVTNGALDGVSAPVGDDFDRVVYKLRLATTKKAVTVLPEEVNSLILTVAQSSVARKTDAEEDPSEYPLAIALPGWACIDSCVEAWMDSLPGAVFYQRSIAALCGSLQPGLDAKAPNPLLDRISNVTKALQQEHQKLNDGTSFEYEPLLILVGISADGVECTAVQVSDVQNNIPACVFGNFKVLCNSSYPTQDAMKLIPRCLTEVYSKLEEVAHEIEGPVAFVPYGTNKQQIAELATTLEKDRTKVDTWENVPVVPSKIDCVPIGTAVLGAVTHGRLATLITNANNKLKPALAMRVHNVATGAVGVRMSYKEGVWTPVKTIFDFDRRVPAGPYAIELSAAQCAAALQAAGENHDWANEVSPDAVETALKDVEGSKGIPVREVAAMAFRLQIVQKLSRDSEWMQVGDTLMPLTKIDEKSKEEKRVGCEKISLELSLNSTGVITSTLAGDLETVTQAVVSSRNSTIRYWMGIILAITFFGGFLVKSYWEERVFERDTKKLLAYYKHVVPNSMADGDVHNARYLVWKYRGKKKALWKRLENKYGAPVLEIDEWPDKEEEHEEEEQNLDEAKDNPEEGQKENPRNDGPRTEEPDL